MGENTFYNFKKKKLKIFGYISVCICMNLLLIKWYFTISYTANTEWSCSYSPSRRWIRTPAPALNAALNKDAISSDHIRQILQAMRVIPWLEMTPCLLRGNPQEGHSLLWYSFPKLKTKFIKSEKQQTSPSLELLYNSWSSIAWDLQFHKENRTAEDMTTKCNAVV